MLRNDKQMQQIYEIKFLSIDYLFLPIYKLSIQLLSITDVPVNVCW